MAKRQAAAPDHDHALKWQRQVADIQLRKAHVDIDLEVRRREAEARDLDNQLDVANQRRLAEVEQMLVQGRALRELVMHALPQIATALQTTTGTVNYTQIGGDPNGGPLNAVPAAFAQLLALAQSFGLELPGKKAT